MIHAEVGDSILIIFKNKASRPYSIAAQGVEDSNNGKLLNVPVTKPGKSHQSLSHPDETPGSPLLVSEGLGELSSMSFSA